jgi:ribonuclease HI
MFGWKKRGWLKSNNQVPENLDIIQAYYEWYEKGFRIDLRKIKGHAGHEWNELADKLATGKVKEEDYGK